MTALSLDYCPRWGDHRPSKLTGHKHGVFVRGWLPWRVYRVCPVCGFKERTRSYRNPHNDRSLGQELS